VRRVSAAGSALAESTGKERKGFWKAENFVAQVSPICVSPIFKSAECEMFDANENFPAQQVEKPAIQQTEKSALLRLRLRRAVFICVHPWLNHWK
jgi:hypothetical protein